MTPERTKIINGHKVEEFYWAGEMVVYVDSRSVDGSFQEVCERLEAEGAA